MPDLIMSTEAAFLLSPEFITRNKRDCPAGKQFETFTQMQGVDPSRIDPAALQEAIDTCARCASRKACRQWLRTGVFAYDGDPRCPNAALLHN
jgi:hypothetical protein